MTHHSIKMYDYHVWANKQILERLKQLPMEISHQEIQSVFPSVAKAMSHIYVVDHGWLGILSGKSMREGMAEVDQVRATVETKSMEEMDLMFFDLSEQFKVFLQGQEDMEKTIMLDNPYAGLRETSLSEMVIQVVNHGTYHRGNISAMLRQLGHSSVMTEYALFWYSK